MGMMMTILMIDQGTTEVMEVVALVLRDLRLGRATQMIGGMYFISFTEYKCFCVILLLHYVFYNVIIMLLIIIILFSYLNNLIYIFVEKSFILLRMKLVLNVTASQNEW